MTTHTPSAARATVSGSIGAVQEDSQHREPGSGTLAWTIGREHVTLDQAGGSIAFRFDARDAHLVLSRRTADPIAFRVLLDGQAPGSSRGVDVDEQGHGLLREGRVYQLARQDGKVRERTLEVTFREPGVEAYVFTFG